MGNMVIRPGFLGFDVFDQFFSTNWDFAIKQTTQGYPVTDIYQTENGSTVMEFALAGFSKDDLKIDIQPEKRTITVSAKSGSETDGCRRIARRSFTKTYVNYDNNLDLKAAKAKFENGLLTVTVPKSGESTPLTVEIQ